VEGNVFVQVLDQQGRLITTKQLGAQHTGEFKTPLDLGRLAKGSYVLRIVISGKAYIHKLLIQ
jgi:flagellar hook assembly protein FlgD